MRGTQMALVLGMIAAFPACWGNEFLTDSDGGGDGAVSARDASTALNCANIRTCSAGGPLCCLSSPIQPSCTAGSCGCYTALACASDENCASPLVCCLQLVTGPDCQTGHFVSDCEAACSSGAQHLCDPSGTPCPTGSCASDTQTLSLYAMPASVGYGVCTQP